MGRVVSERRSDAPSDFRDFLNAPKPRNRERSKEGKREAEQDTERPNIKRVKGKKKSDTVLKYF